MILKFECTKKQFVDGMKKELGVQSILVENDSDVTNLIGTWLSKTGVNGEQGEMLRAKQCSLNGDQVVIGLIPTPYLLMFSGPEGLREPDRKWMVDVFNSLQETILSPVSSNSQ